MAISFSRPDPSSPAAVADANFPTSRRGFDQQQVREFLRMVAAELARSQERERYLEQELKARRQEPAPALPTELDDETVARLLGEETTRIIQAARESAATTRLKAQEVADRLLRDAREEAQRLREDVETEVARRRKDSENEAAAELEAAKQQGREMVEEARAYREKALSELARRRDLARQQIDHLVHARERLVQAFERARLAAADVVNELAPLGEFDEYVNLAPTTGPVPMMVPAARLGDASSISDDALRLPADPPATADGPAAPASVRPPAADQAGTAAPPGQPVQDATTADEVTDESADATAEIVVEPPPADGAADSTATDAESTATDADSTATDADSTATDADSTAGEADVTSPIEAATVVDSTVDDAVGSGAGAGDVDTGNADEVEDPAATGESPADGSDDEIVAGETVVDPAGERVGRSATVLQFPAGRRADTTTAEPDPTDTTDTVDTTDTTDTTDTPPGDDEIDDDDVTASDVDSLFARLRAQQDVTTAIPVPAAAVDGAPFEQRDEALTPLIVASGRKLKRVLADEQNAALDRLRRKDAVTHLDELVGDEVTHVGRYFDAISAELMSAASAGASALGGGDISGDALAAAGEALRDDLVRPLRDRLASRVADAASDNEVIAKSARAIYREWKTKHIDDHLDDLLRIAYNRGALASVAAGTPLRWVADPSVGACSECEDNTLQGLVPAGDPFPTGHVTAPAHAGCRCLLAPASP